MAKRGRILSRPAVAKPEKKRTLTLGERADLQREVIQSLEEKNQGPVICEVHHPRLTLKRLSVIDENRRHCVREFDAVVTRTDCPGSIVDTWAKWLVQRPVIGRHWMFKACGRTMTSLEAYNRMLGCPRLSGAGLAVMGGALAREMNRLATVGYTTQSSQRITVDLLLECLCHDNVNLDTLAGIATEAAKSSPKAQQILFDAVKLVDEPACDLLVVMAQNSSLDADGLVDLVDLVDQQEAKP